MLLSSLEILPRRPSTELEFTVTVREDFNTLHKVVTLRSESGYEAVERLDYDDLSLIGLYGLTPWDFMRDAIDVLSRMEME